MISRFLFFVLIACLCMQTANAQVNLQTGSAEFNLPLYNYKDVNNRLTTDISLLYTAGNGLKVDEIPSGVGAGWELQAGGFIQRIQHGEPDDQRSTGVLSQNYPLFFSDLQDEVNFRNWVLTYYPDGYLYTNADAIDDLAAYSPMFSTTNYLYKPKPEYQADREQDLFVFNFNGKSGYFLISKKGPNGVSEIRTLYDTKLKIKEIYGDIGNTNNIRTTISEFQITDENGTVYVFKDADLNQICVFDKEEWYRNETGGFNPGYGFTIENLTIPYYLVSRGTPKNSFTKNKWYLSEIYNPLSNVKIKFEYDEYQMDIQGHKTALQTTTDNSTSFTVVVERIKGTFKRLRKITFSEHETADFIYSPLPRADVSTDNALEKISIKYDGTEKLSWIFKHGYFVKNERKAFDHLFTSEQRTWARLTLDELRRVGTGFAEENPYIFDYFLGNEDAMVSAVPPLFSFYQDVWGYYNATNYGFLNPSDFTASAYNAPFEPFDGKMLPKAEMQKALGAGPLQGVTHKARGLYLCARAGMLRSVTNPLKGSLEFSYGQNYFSYSGPSFIGGGGVIVSQTKEYDGIDHANDVVTDYKYTKADGVTTSGWGSDSHVFQSNEVIRLHKKCGDNKYPAVDYVSLAVAAQKYASFSGTAFAGIGEQALLSCFQQMIVGVLVKVLIELFSDDWKEYQSYQVRSDLFNAHNLLAFQYSRVEVINKAGAGNIGKTVYEFTSPEEPEPEFSIDIPSLAAPFASKQRYAYWLYGLPKTVTVFDKDGLLVKRTENKYHPVKYTTTDARYKSRKWVPKKRVFGCDFIGFDYVFVDNDWLTEDPYYPIFGRIELENSKEYDYNKSQQYTLQTTNYEYSTDNYQMKKVSTNNSRGELMETYSYYPTDYTISGPLQAMKNDHNMIGIPIATQTFVTKGSGQKYLVAGSISEYGTAPNGDIKPVKTYSAMMSDPVASSNVTFNPGQLVPNSTVYEDGGNIIYDALGMPIQVNTKKGKSSTLFDYDGKAVIASVVNADYADIAYTSFETAQKGQWNFSVDQHSTAQFLTGKKSYVFSVAGSSIYRAVNSSKTYMLSFWAKGNAPYVYKLSGGSPSAFSPQRTYTVAETGWTYYEYSISGAAAVYLDNSLNATLSAPFAAFIIDELRLCPVEARMSTTAYDPIFGKTEEADPNGRITYYEYDRLGRLQFIRDERKNIVKMYEYNYKQ